MDSIPVLQSINIQVGRTIRKLEFSRTDDTLLKQSRVDIANTNEGEKTEDPKNN